jgi:hypothetical protein
LPTRVADVVKKSYAAASRPGPQVSDRAPEAFVSAMHVALLTAAGAVVLAAVATVILLARRWRTASTTEAAMVADHA